MIETNLEILGVDRLDLVYLRIGTMTPPTGESVAARFETPAAHTAGSRRPSLRGLAASPGLLGLQ